MKKLTTLFLGAALLLGVAGGSEAIAATKKKAKARTSAYAPKKYISKSSYRGSIGPYAITMTLYKIGEHFSQATREWHEYKGSYTYTKAGNTLRLEGQQGALTGWHFLLSEYTPKGRNSGHFDLEELDNGNLSGTFTNSSTGEEFYVYLTKIR